jgi:hypothetical protein
MKPLLVISQWRFLDILAGFVFSGGGSVILFVSKQMIPTWQASHLFKSLAAFCTWGFIIFAGVALILQGLRLFMGYSGITIDANTQQIIVWKRSFLLIKNVDRISYSELKQIRVRRTVKEGLFAKIELFCLSIEGVNESVEIRCFSKENQAKEFAKTVAEVTAIPIATD